MAFNSVKFLFFFVIVITIYFSIPHRIRWVWLLGVSYYFYMSWKPVFIILIILTTLITYYAGVQMGKTELKSKRKTILILSLFFNLGLLFLFKYFNFFSSSSRDIFRHFGLIHAIPSLNLLLPVGISFYIFKSVSYLIDVYRGDKTFEKHIGLLALYVSFFPQLLAGPIERATRFLPQLYEKFDFDYERSTNGLKLMLWGFFQKMVIADNLATFVDSVYSSPAPYQGFSLLAAAAFYSLQIYCDFSGYSDIAIGAAQVMGFTTMVNFDRPYFSKSIPEFWRRWHISLSTWFRDYLYIPLGGNRVSIPRWYFNLFFVLLICGLWHGANWTFVVWGGLHGFYLVVSALTHGIRGRIHKIIRLDKVPRLHDFIKTLVTFSLVSLAWIFFRAHSNSDAIHILSRLFTGWQDIFQADFLIKNSVWGSLKFQWITGLASVGVLMLVEGGARHGSIVEMISARPIWIRWPAYYFILLSILLFGRFETKQFIYFQF